MTLRYAIASALSLLAIALPCIAAPLASAALPPDSVQAMPLRSAAALRWLPVEEVAGYNVYRAMSDQDPATSDDFERVNAALLPQPVHHFRDVDVVDGMTYSYYLTSVDSEGKESDPSQVVSVLVGSAGFRVRPFPYAWPAFSRTAMPYLLVFDGTNDFEGQVVISKGADWPAGFDLIARPPVVDLQPAASLTLSVVWVQIGPDVPVNEWVRLPLSFNAPDSAQPDFVHETQLFAYVMAPSQSFITTFTAPVAEIGQPVTITGRILPRPTVPVQVTFDVRRPDASALDVTAVLSNDEGWFQAAFTPDQIGSWSVTATADGRSSTPWDLDVFAAKTDLVLYYQPTGGSSASTTGKISGKIVPTPLDGEATEVSVELRSPTGRTAHTWPNLAADGSFAFDFDRSDYLASGNGQWQVTAAWEGSTQFGPSAGRAVFPVGEPGTGRALIVVGQDAANAHDQALRDDLAARATDILMSRGFTAATVTRLPETTGAATSLDAIAAVIDGARGDSAVSREWPFVLYLVGPAGSPEQPGVVIADGELLTSEWLAAELADMPSIVILEADRSGALAPGLASSDPLNLTTFTIASAAADQESILELPGEDGGTGVPISFSDSFWSGIAANQSLGIAALLGAEAIKSATQDAQTPVISVLGESPAADTLIVSQIFVGYPSTEWSPAPAILELGDVLTGMFDALTGVHGYSTASPERTARAAFLPIDISLRAPCAGATVQVFVAGDSPSTALLSDTDGNCTFTGSLPLSGATYRVYALATSATGARSAPADVAVVNQPLLIVPAAGPLALLAAVTLMSLAVAVVRRSIRR
ncbi:MAG: hypothetical protein HYV63_22340 [Candidatus Schekmanbacteria bacterium]|nr:hypothetical protein [Candidatus Schekmanbacteria bacterium]